MIYKDGTCIISNVGYADTTLKRTLGLMFHRKIKSDYGLVFSLEKEMACDVHMLFVPFDIDILFLDSDCVILHIETLKAWTGRCKCVCNSFVECSSGTALKHGVCVGDVLKIKKE